jgi:hypothetical protein
MGSRGPEQIPRGANSVPIPHHLELKSLTAGYSCLIPRIQRIFWLSWKVATVSIHDLKVVCDELLTKSALRGYVVAA